MRSEGDVDADNDAVMSFNSRDQEKYSNESSVGTESAEERKQKEIENNSINADLISKNSGHANRNFFPSDIHR